MATPCDASRTYRAGLRGLGSAKHALDAVFVNQRRSVALKHAPGGDVSPAQIGVAVLDLKRRSPPGVRPRARGGPGVSRSRARHLRRRFAIRAKVVETDDAAAWSGSRAADCSSLLRVGTGAGRWSRAPSVRVKGVGFKDGSGVATDTSPSAGGRTPGPSCPRKCLTLRIAPVQGFPPFVDSSPITLHNLPPTATPRASTGSSSGCG